MSKLPSSSWFKRIDWSQSQLPSSSTLPAIKVHTIEFYCSLHRHHRLRMRKTGPSWFIVRDSRWLRHLERYLLKDFVLSSLSESRLTLNPRIRLVLQSNQALKTLTPFRTHPQTRNSFYAPVKATFSWGFMSTFTITLNFHALDCSLRLLGDFLNLGILSLPLLSSVYHHLACMSFASLFLVQTGKDINLLLTHDNEVAWSLDTWAYRSPRALQKFCRRW